MGMLLRRPLLIFTISYILGTITASINSSYLICATISIIVCLSLALVMNYVDVDKWLIVGVTLLFLISSFRFLITDKFNSHAYELFNGKNVEITGYIASVAEIKSSTLSYIIQPEEILSSSDGIVLKNCKAKILVSTVIKENQPIIEYGREVKFKGELTKPAGVRNPAGFDYRRYLAQKGVAARLFTMEIERTGRVKTYSLTETGINIRNRIVYVIERSLPEQQAGLLNGMLIGYREGLTSEVQEAFTDSGLTHIMAVSGANTAFIALPVAFLLKKLRVPTNLADILLICFLIMFVFITGFEASVLRAVAMASLFIIGRILMRDTDTITLIAFSALILLIYNPYMMFNIGFQLSYGATLSLVTMFNYVKKLLEHKFIPPVIREILAATLTAQLGVLPITLYYFNRISIISLLSNLLVVPLLEIITIGGMLMAVFGQFFIAFSKFLGIINNILLTFILYVVKYSSQVPFAVIQEH
jgi:competence protein ComEC